MFDVEELRRGGELIFNRIYEKYFRLVFYFAYKEIRDYHYAQDASQEVFIRMWKYRNSYSEAMGDFKAWFVKLARNTIKTFAGKVSKYKAYICLIEEIDDVIDESTKSGYAKIDCMKNLLGPIEYQIMVLKLYYGYSFKMISQIIKQNESNVKFWYYCTLKKIKNDLF